MRGNMFIAFKIADPPLICVDLDYCSVAELEYNQNCVLNKISAKQ